MPVGLRVDDAGIRAMRSLAADFKAMPKDIKGEMYSSLGKAGKRLGELARANAADVLPGDLGAYVGANLKVRTATRFGSNPSVKLTGTVANPASAAFHKQRRKAIRRTRARQKRWRNAQGG